MTYLELVNNFWRRNCDVHFVASATCLYFYLLNECNVQRWPKTFHIPTSIIVDELKISRPTFVSARNTLVEAGLIEVKTSQGKRDSRYRIVDADFWENGKKKKPTKDPQTANNEDDHQKKFDVDYVKSLVKLFNKMSATEFTSVGIDLLEELVKNIYKSTEELVKSLVNSLVKKFDKFTLYIKDNKTLREYYATLRIGEEGSQGGEEGSQGVLDFPSSEGNSDKKKGRTPLPDPPTYEDVRNQFLLSHADTRLQDWEYAARYFYDWFSYRDWKDKYGSSMLRKWQARANLWINDKESEEKKSNQQNAIKSNGPYTNRLTDAELAKQKRDESYERAMRELLSSPDPGSAEMP